MADVILNHKCPACTGPLQFSSETGRLECEYCGSSFSVEEIEAFYAEKEQKAAEALNQENRKDVISPSNESDTEKADPEGQTADEKSSKKKKKGYQATKEEQERRKAAREQKEAEKAAENWNLSSIGTDWGEDAGKMRAYNCSSCGAELICEQTTAATSCPYCGNPAIVPGQFGGTLRPDYIIPFKKNREQAMEALKKHYRRRPLLPSVFSSENQLEELKGIYVPFWLYDGEVRANLVFDGIRSSEHREGDYIVTVSRHYSCRREGSMKFENVPADGSVKMDDTYMESLEPYDFSEMVPFSTAYLPGFWADRYDRDAALEAVRANNRCVNSTVETFRADVTGYDKVNMRSKDVRVIGGDVKYALLPVWTIRTKWKDKEYLFMMNGQTEKMTGELPISRMKSRLWFWGTFAAAAVLFYSIGLGGAIGRFVLWFLE